MSGKRFVNKGSDFKMQLFFPFSFKETWYCVREDKKNTVTKPNISQIHSHLYTQTWAWYFIFFKKKSKLV